jgi:hypothetical protein
VCQRTGEKNKRNYIYIYIERERERERERDMDGLDLETHKRMGEKIKEIKK